MIDINEPHKSVSNSKDNSPKHWDKVHEPMIVPNSSTHYTNVYEYHSGVTPPVKIAKVSFSVREVVKPRKVIEGVSEIIETISAHDRPDVVLLPFVIPHSRLFPMKSNPILVNKVHLPFIMLS